MAGSGRWQVVGGGTERKLVGSGRWHGEEGGK